MTTIGRISEKKAILLTLVLWAFLGNPFAMAADTTTGLVGRWSFEGGLADDSGSNAAGSTVNGVGYTNGILGSGLAPLSSGGLQRYANLGHGTAITGLSGQFTYSAWIYYTGSNGTSGNRSTILARMSPNVWLMDILEPARSLRFILYTGSGSVTAGNVGVIPTNTWTHVAATYDGTRIILYTNGVALCTNNVAGTPVSSTTADLSVGARIDNTLTYGWNGGVIDEVRAYARPLSAADLQALGSPTTLAITNLANGGLVTNPFQLRGSATSPFGISVSKLMISNTNGTETQVSDLTLDPGGNWSIPLTLPLGNYQALVLVTNSNAVATVSASVSFTVTAFSTLTVRTLDSAGLSIPGGRIFGPGSNAAGGLRTNDLAGEVRYVNLQVGQWIALTNLSPLLRGQAAQVTNFTMPETDTTLVWTVGTALPAATTSTGSASSTPAFLTRVSSDLSIPVDLKGMGHPRITVSLVRLADGLRKIVYDGVQYGANGNDASVRLGAGELRAILTPGPWVLETRLRPANSDEASTSVQRRLVFYAL